MLLASDDVYNPEKDIIINNVAIQHSAWNIDRTQQADGAAAAYLPYDVFFVVNTSYIVISNVEISHTGHTVYGLIVL